MKLEDYPLHNSIRGWFGRALYFEMKENEEIYVITADLGFGLFDMIRQDFPKRFYNVGASECAAVGAGIGLALSGKIPFVFSITTFLIYRPYEWLRNFLHYENIPVILVGSGWGNDYEHDGITHQPFEAGKVLDTIPNIEQFYPDFKEEVPYIVKELVKNHKPSFLCLRR